MLLYLNAPLMSIARSLTSSQRLLSSRLRRLWSLRFKSSKRIQINTLYSIHKMTPMKKMTCRPLLKVRKMMSSPRMCLRPRSPHPFPPWILKSQSRCSIRSAENLCHAPSNSLSSSPPSKCNSKCQWTQPPRPPKIDAPSRQACFVCSLRAR